MVACPGAFAFNTPPLVTPELVFAKRVFAVKLRLDEPILQRPNLKQLVGLCAVADALIERVQKLLISSDSFDVKIFQDIESMCKQIAPGRSMQETLQSLGLFDMYPYLQQGLTGDQLEQASQHLGQAYLHYVSLLNQVVMMGTQLYNDACVPQHHKYCAHQIAQLYQCLNMLQGDTKPVRRLIEARFEEIKWITESENPVLDLELSDWLQEITWLCREEIKGCPAYIHKRLQPMAKILKACS